MIIVNKRKNNLKECFIMLKTSVKNNVKVVPMEERKITAEAVFDYKGKLIYLEYGGNVVFDTEKWNKQNNQRT